MADSFVSDALPAIIVNDLEQSQEPVATAPDVGAVLSGSVFISFLCGYYVIIDE
jgi:hypothetical protein